MATKKKATKRTAKKTASRRRAAGHAKSDLPSGFGEYVAEVQEMLDGIEREITKAGTRTRKEGARLLREASRQLGRIEERGEKSWERLTERAREEALRLIDKLRASIAPAPARRARRRTV